MLPLWPRAHSNVLNSKNGNELTCSDFVLFYIKEDNKLVETIHLLKFFVFKIYIALKGMQIQYKKLKFFRLVKNERIFYNNDFTQRYIYIYICR